MNILIAIGGKEYSKPTLDLGMKIANSFEASTTIAYVGKKISQFSEKDVSVVHQNLDDRELYRPGVRTLEWAYDFLESKNYIKKKDSNINFSDHLIIDEENSRMRVILKGSHSNKIDLKRGRGLRLALPSSAWLSLLSLSRKKRRGGMRRMRRRAPARILSNFSVEFT